MVDVSLALAVRGYSPFYGQNLTALDTNKGAVKWSMDRKKAKTSTVFLNETRDKKP